MANNHKNRSGFSMIELLIVVAISMLLIAIAIPFIRPGLETSKLREASRILNTYMVGAKARAAESGRPFGVRFVRSSVDQTGDPNDCYRLQYVEVPPAYCGDVDNATIKVGGPLFTTMTGPLTAANPYAAYLTNAALQPFIFSARLDPAFGQDASSQLLKSSAQQFVINGSETVQEAWDRANRNAAISPGDSIRLGYQGVSYLIIDLFIDATSMTRLTLAPISDSGTVVGGIGFSPWPPNPSSGPNRPYTIEQTTTFQIIRKPRIAGSTMIELPSDISIDLAMSGVGIAGNQFFAASNPANAADVTYQDPKPIDIVFDPSGQMSMVGLGGVIQQANASIYLLVGRTDKVYSGIGGRAVTAVGVEFSDVTKIENLTSSDTLWVAVQYPTGAILTAENVGSGAPALNLARDIARSGIAKGSR